MPATKTYYTSFLILTALLLCFLVINVSLGSVAIPLKEIFASVLGDDVEKPAWKYIVLHYRLPKAITAMLAGSGLALSGLLMQTLFRNPLAGPFVLGISSGASLGAALLIMGSGILSMAFAFTVVSPLTLAAASSLGSFLVLLVVMIVAARIRDTMAILIIGLMFGSITAAVVSVLSFFSRSEALQQYIFWSMGSLGNLTWPQLGLLFFVFLTGLALSVASLKALNSLLLGENYARSLGLRLKRSRYMIIIATSLLAGSITSFAGPIAFVGLAVPHLTRQVFNTTDHKILLPAVLLYGAILMLV
ncbi:MAG: iron ABC transporter permease, partial [Sinomicrobium sp.]|nr:iron ABC transporter permease [Sinomicrobium sp.]